MKSLFLLIAVVALASLSASAQKLSAEELVAKHLDSIGTTADRAKIKNIVAAGEVSFAQGLNDKNSALGKGVIASEGAQSALAMSFPIQLYPTEKIIFDGKRVNVAFVRPGVRSAFGEYLTSYENIVNGGLLGGTLTTTWAFYNDANKKAKMSVEGLKKIDGKEMYAVRYNPKGGSDVDIRLFFDKDTFRHVRTEYKRTISAQMGANPNLSASQTETTENLTEEFGDFKTENGLTLPRSYKIRLRIDRGKATREYFYNFALSTFYYNQQLDAATFASN